MHLFVVYENLTLSGFQGPNEGDFVFRSAAIGSNHALFDGFIAGNSKLENDLFLRETKRFCRVFDPVVDLVRDKRGHDCCWFCYVVCYDGVGLLRWSVDAVVLTSSRINFEKTSGNNSSSFLPCFA